MMEENTNTKCCSRCKENKDCEKFIKKRNICKDCSNKWAKIARDTRHDLSFISNIEKICKICNETKNITDLIKNRYLCKDCNNKNYRDKYKKDEEFCLKVRLKDKNKNRKVSNEAQKKRYHSNPIEKFLKVQRSRIAIALKNKQKHTIEYLGCDAEQYYNWLQFNFNDTFKFDNYGKEWHIDHVIPLHNFNLENEQEQLLAFNWRNTMPLSVKENLKKGINIISLQIEQHLEKLKEYHLENKLDLPQVFIDLFATSPN
jgi:hypothetical protein